MNFFKKITEYLCNMGHVFLCWGLFAISTTILCALVWYWISSDKKGFPYKEESNIERIDTLYVIVKPEIDEFRLSTHSENKDSLWIAPIKTSNRTIIKEDIKQE
mgnify:CR=1 FL=1